MIALVLGAAAATLSIPFAPPATTFRYEKAQEQDVRAGKWHFSVVWSVRFAPDGAGRRLEMTVTDYSTDATGNPKQVFENSVAVLKGYTFAYKIGANGAIIEPIDFDKGWARMVESFETAMRISESDPAATPEKKAGIRALVASVENAPLEARKARLMEDTRQLTDHAAITAPIGEAVGFSQAPAGPARISGSETLTGSDGDIAHFVLDSRTDPASGAMISVTEHVEADISRTTGLLVKSVRTRVNSGPGNLTRTMIETRTLTPSGG